MKTAISIPDDLYQMAKETAREMGIPRSQLISRALRDYLARHNPAAITRKLNRVYSQESGAGKAPLPSGSLAAFRESVRDDWW